MKSVEDKIKDRLQINPNANLKDPKNLIGLMSRMQQLGYQFNWVVSDTHTFFEIWRGTNRKISYADDWEKYWCPVLEAIERISENEDYDIN